MDAYAHRNGPVVHLGAMTVVLDHLFLHLHCALDGLIGSAALREQGHDAISHVLVDEAAMAGYHRHHAREVRINEGKTLLGGKSFRHLGERPDVGEEYGHILFDVVAEAQVEEISLLQVVEELGGNKALDRGANHRHIRVQCGILGRGPGEFQHDGEKHHGA
ncbi:MAG: hypothetical protein A2Y38_03500 [Spirochaetes bacterium GWB1_59_5]|nr:MAG: hypothetical protein A2Y38_03500 [Spirochaetes bacterium GWB1_59_5]